jgi:hypothetical protein
MIDAKDTSFVVVESQRLTMTNKTLPGRFEISKRRLGARGFGLDVMIHRKRRPLLLCDSQCRFFSNSVFTSLRCQRADRSSLGSHGGADTVDSASCRNQKDLIAINVSVV